jgi:hypothetical protein
MKRTQLNRAQACARLACVQMKRAQSFRAQRFLNGNLNRFMVIYFVRLLIIIAYIQPNSSISASLLSTKYKFAIFNE